VRGIEESGRTQQIRGVLPGHCHRHDVNDYADRRALGVLAVDGQPAIEAGELAVRVKQAEMADGELDVAGARIDGVERAGLRGDREEWADETKQRDRPGEPDITTTNPPASY
jgi:hypothetical protein